MLVRFLLGFISGTLLLFLLMLPIAIRHGWSSPFVLLPLCGGLLIGSLALLFAPDTFRSLFRNWLSHFK